MPPERGPAFAEVWPAVDAVGGWLTRDQAQLLWDAVRAVDPGPARVLEIGSHRGRSTCALAAARPDVDVTAVDPFVTTRRYPGPSVRLGLEATLEALGVADRVTVLPVPSAQARRGWDRPLDVLHVDGKHDYWTVSDDLHWADHVVAGGTVLVHDAFSSIGVTLALLRHVLPGDRLAYRGRVGSMARFVVARPTTGDRAAMLRELPWWGRNVVVKVLLRLRLRRVAALLGHHGRDDPY
ncbi:class I SAM-dependent methyltransferase [Phycicoccus sonneratiae]|uniref:Class I SAM-dependent methyltransferase n=1 Tax=Phycicoccus sonneratiae TaxID=2807628 RepID=A0ABS2CHY5_9MICO|nr:class I SAM-dependent methyltransferase [Phycicoccus sonneraticus]MBM6399485.1 class I SAM-dependent methyltransferase [Phycicoccus sonneraticus]